LDRRIQEEEFQGRPKHRDTYRIFGNGQDFQELLVEFLGVSLSLPLSNNRSGTSETYAAKTAEFLAEKLNVKKGRKQEKAKGETF
jgi:hypothetical protein